jgi:Mn2+/Fe2+ NRAMP family transporter
VRKTKKTSEKQKGFLRRLGPGLITGASDDDPSGIGTYSQAGAQLGFGIGWTMLLTYPLMAAIQEISARIGRVTGSPAMSVGISRPRLSGPWCYCCSVLIRSTWRRTLARWRTR